MKYFNEQLTMEGVGDWGDIADRDPRYYPLPTGFTIGHSRIHGLGLITLNKLKPETDLGITHVERPGFQDGYVRTPLGGFINHSKEPNSRLYKVGEIVLLETVEIVNAGDEVTVEYGTVASQWRQEDDGKQ